MMHKAAPSSASIIWLMCGLLLGALPHFMSQPFWVSLVFLIGLVWRCLNIWFDWPLPHQMRLLRLVQLMIASFAILSLLLSYGTTIGRDAGVAFLIMMLGLKVAEIKTQRDYYITTFLGYFVVITNFFFTQSIPMVVLMCGVVILMTGCLITLNDEKRVMSVRDVGLMSSRLLLQSLPIMLILFVLFPRIPGPLWGIPKDAYAGKTGMDDTMKLDNISQLILSDEVAFRVEFEGALPPPSQRYWRGPVLWHTDGVSWSELSRNQQSPIEPDIRFTGHVYRYSIMLEPHNEHWLFALDMPNQLPENINAHFSPDGQLRSNDAINQRVRYSLSSQTDYRFNNTDDPLIKAALYLPESIHPRTKALAKQWRETLHDDEDYIRHVLQYFNAQDYYYTLSPPPITGDPIDGFLLDTRKGFCEHYSASFTVLMRAAGIPARVVNGYQGGEINPVNGELVVRQRDAHAWSEVWLAGKGWVRVDPTSAVASERIELGINEIMPRSMRSPMLVAKSDVLIEVWQTISHNVDALNSLWNSWILAYGPERQKDFLQKLGMKNPDWQKIALWMTIMLCLAFIALPLYLFYQKSQTLPAVKLYQKFCNKLSRFQLEKADSEGPKAFAERAVKVVPDSATEIHYITRLYINQLYAVKSEPIHLLTEAVKQFKPEQTHKK